eukprot:Gb_24098 [translate_table: standard]
MQLLFHAHSDGLGEIEDRSGSLLQSCGSASSDDSSDSPWVSPRIGDEYQANVSPFKPRKDCPQLGLGESMNTMENYDEENEQLFVEGLPVPVMQISHFIFGSGVKETETHYVNGPSLDNGFAKRDESSITTVKLECGLSPQDFIESADEGCSHELNFTDNFQLTEDNAGSSVIDMKTEVSRADDACTDSTVAVDNELDAFYSRRGQHKKRGRVGWKRVKKVKFDLLNSGNQSSNLNSQTQLTGLCKGTSLRSYIIVPGSPSASWSKSEEDVFILGLYIFGKNLIAVKRFLETKEIGDILSYYYGKFFGTESYCRWAEFRKTRSRKCIQGQRIFSGWRQQELVARLLPHIPEHSKHEVPKVTKAFNEGRISMEEFVMKLKALAGLNALVQAVGIGQGKQDLTAAHMEPMKSNQVTSFRTEIPVGNACSSLSIEEIVKFLTGDFRLSKTRANDLFWEAVWPRLLARGWHSELPEDQAHFGSRPSLVFLIPSVQKFSRRKLVKGIHYFDSVSEVLGRVALDPSLLELEMDDIMENEVKPECLRATEISEEENGNVGNTHCYLRPRFCTNYSDSFKFTVVDTSLTSQGEEPERIRESRTLPAEDDSERPQSVSAETEDKDDLVSHLHEQDKHAVGNLLNTDPEVSPHIVISNENPDGRNTISGLWKISTSDELDYLCSPSEQRSPSKCNCSQVDAVDGSLIGSSDTKEQGSMLKFDYMEGMPEAFSGSSPLAINISLPLPIQASPEKKIRATLLSRDLISGNSFSNSSQYSGLCRLTPSAGLGWSMPQDQPENALVIPIPSSGTELLEVSKSEDNSQLENSHPEEDSGHPQQEPTHSGLAQSSSPSPDENRPAEPQENNTDVLLENVRRQSKRTRPLTTRALEAFACGFFTTRQRRKGGKSTSNPYSPRTRSVSRLIQDDVSCSLNNCTSDSNGITILDTNMESWEGDSNSDAQPGVKSLVSKRRR